MEVPRNSYKAMHSRLRQLFPDIFQTGKELLNIDEYEPDTNALIEPVLEYDSEAVPDLIIQNAQVFTNDTGKLQDIAIKGNIIIRITHPGEIDLVAEDGTTIVDAKGNSVLPGFCDSHLHLLVAAQRLKWCNMEEIKSADEFRRRLLEFAKKKTDEPVLYCYGVHYFDPPLIPAERARSFLDEIVPDRPVFVCAHDLHTAWANTRAIEISGLLHPMPPYPAILEMLDLDGNIVLGPDMIPGGEFREPEVYFLVEGLLQSRFPKPIDERIDDLCCIFQELASLGFTSVHHMGLSHPVEDISFLLMALELEQLGDLPIRIYSSISSIADWDMIQDVNLAYMIRNALMKARKKELTAAQIHDFLISHLEHTGGRRHKTITTITHNNTDDYPILSRFLQWSKLFHDIIRTSVVEPHQKRENIHNKGNSPEYLCSGCKVRCDTVKIFMDGVIEKDTAYRLDQKPKEGIPEFTPAELDMLVLLSDRLGMQVAAHSIGDASVQSMLDVISRARKKHSMVDKKRGHCILHRIEHIEMCTSQDILRFGKEHVVASMQPLHERPPGGLWHTKVPEAKWETAFPWKELSENGAVLVYGSDWPIVSCDVLEGVHHAVTRKPWSKGGRDQKLSLKQALDAYTCNAAVTEYAANQRGKLKPGMLADIVILDGIVTDLQNDVPPAIGIRMTICDGKITYDNLADTKK